jgi:hypothetical protein
MSKRTAKNVTIDSPELVAHATEIRRLGKQTTDNIIEIGKRLTECKKLVGHGGFSAWLEREFNWKERTAQRFMQVAHVFGSNPSGLTDLDLPLEGLYLLAAPSTPQAAREEIIERAEKGEKLTGDDVKDTISAKKPAGETLPPRQKPPVCLSETPSSPMGAFEERERFFKETAHAAKVRDDASAVEPQQPEPPKTASAAAASQAMPGTIGPMMSEAAQDVRAGSAAEAERLRARVEELQNEKHQLKMEVGGLRSQLDEQWDELKAHIGAEADAAPLWSRLQHLLSAALAACEREANWPPLKPEQQQRRAKAMEDLRAAMSELLDLASPAPIGLVPAKVNSSG